MSIGLVLVDPHPIVLEGLEALIAPQADMRILARCSTGQGALEALRDTPPDVLVMDLDLPDIPGLEIMRALRGNGQATRFVLFVSQLDDDQAIEAMQLGVDGMMLKEMPTRLVLQCIRKVHEGGRWLETQSIARLVERLHQPEIDPDSQLARLSPRELDVTRLVVAGLNNKDIAARLELSIGTIKIHLHNIYEKLGIRSRLQLAAFARENDFN